MLVPYRIHSHQGKPYFETNETNVFPLDATQAVSRHHGDFSFGDVAGK
jgi:hypothetical protein